MKFLLQIIRKFFCYLVILVTSLFGRVFQSPAISDWLWYSGTFEYPLDFYFYNKRSNFCFDIGVNYTNRYADIALGCQSISRGRNLSVLFHGSDNFILTDFQPQTNNITAGTGGTYEFLPDYVLNESYCNINVQVSRDFEYYDDRYFHSTIRCIIPFARQSVLNVSSGNFYVNTTMDAVLSRKNPEEKKAFLKRNQFLSNKEKENKLNNKIVRCSFDMPEKKVIDPNRNIISPYIKLENGEAGQNYFAIQGSYFKTFNNEIFDYLSNQMNIPFVVYNKNGAPGYYLDDQKNNLSLDEICHSYSLVSDVNNNALYSQIVGFDGNVVKDINGISYNIQNSSFATTGIIPGNALISFYTYGNSDSVKNGFYVSSECGFAYPLVTQPQYISDVQVGDLVTSTNIVYGDGQTGEINSINLLPNQLVRVVATGPYGNNPYLTNEWERDKVIFNIPPVIMQYSEEGFPVNFGVPIDVRNLEQSYSRQPGGVQFDFYGDFLKNNPNNNNPKLTILNQDGTFYDSSAQVAMLWYQNDYSNLFYNPTDSRVINNLKNLYMTSSIYADTKLPSDASRLIADKIGSNPGPDPDCCETLHDWVAGCVAPTIINVMNSNIASLQNQIWSIENVGNNICGNESPITTEVNQGVYTPDLSDNPYCQLYASNIEKKSFDDISASSEFDKRLVDSCVNFSNGKFAFMQYNGFHQSGLGNIAIEFLGGSYFLENKLLFDVYIALECPTAEGVNNSRSYLAMGIGNNGHYVGKIGLQGFFDIEGVYRFRLSSKMYLERGFASMEKLVPQFEGYPIFGLNPLKMDTMLGWNGGLVYFDGSMYVNDYSGFTFSYQYWKKGQDCIIMNNPKKIFISNMPNTVDSYVIPSFDDVKKMSARVSHTLGVSFFSRLANELFLNCGMSRVCAGYNVPQSLDMFCSLGLSY